MSTMKVTLEISVSGPLADGTAHDAAREWIDDSKKHIADYAVRQLKSVGMDKTGRATGRYQDSIQISVLSYNDLLIHDPVIYGPWLEGTSERNRSTRFKGYHLWRMAKQRTGMQKDRIAEDLLPKYAARMGITP